MITVVPAILTNDSAELRSLLLEYTRVGFTLIDIDIQEVPFVSDPTLPWREVVDIVRELSAELTSVSIGWDLKLAAPLSAVEAIRDMGRKKDRMYVYQSADIEWSRKLDCYQERISLGVLDTDELVDIDWYAHYPEIQLMTVTAEQQGAQLSEKLLSRVEDLRRYGFPGHISIDGGVNLESTDKIRTIAPDRVSVGSYFQHSEQLEMDKDRLEARLNY